MGPGLLNGPIPSRKNPTASFGVGGSDSRNSEAKKAAWYQVVLLRGYSRCTLGGLPRFLALRPKTADSGLEPEDQLEILALQLGRAL